MKIIKLTIFLYFIFFQTYTYSNSDFNSWMISFKKKALSQGVTEKTFNIVMSEAKYLPKVIEYDRYQPEFYEDTLTYISKRTSSKKIVQGLKLYKKNKSILGGEQSGHIILSDYSNTGDGILAALKIIEILSKFNLKSSKAFNIYKSYPQKKINIPFLKLSKKNHKFIKSLSNDKSLNKNNMRSLIRISGTEPLIRILVEGPDYSKVEECSKNIENKVRLNLEK